MDLTLPQQIVALIERSQNILLCTHRKPDGDAVGSIMALSKALKLIGKKVTAACADEIPESFDFLPEVGELVQEVGAGQDFVVTLDCDETEVDRLKYHLEDNKIHIVITPKKGRFQEKNVSCQQNQEPFDLILTVDVADVPQLGKLYEDHTDLFTALPVVNIDHHLSNTQFGKLNWIDVSASSTAEILYGLIQALERHFGKSLITPEVATFLLSGITTDTGSFQNANTTPKAMEIAASLMDAGADQQDIIKYLFRTKKLSTLKLYGKILARIEVDQKHRLVWSSITQQDLKNTEADMEDAAGIIDELMVHAPEAEIVALFKENDDVTSVSFRSTNDQANVMEVAQHFGGGGHVRAAGIKMPGKTLSEVTNRVLAYLHEYQRQRLGLDQEEQEEGGGEAAQPLSQVLDGYTPNQAIQPTLEQRASVQTLDIPQSKEPFTAPAAAPGRVEPSPPPAAAQTHSGSEGREDPGVGTATGALEEKAKKAIEAEQGMAHADQGAFSPSQSAQRDRSKPPGEKRFTQEVPDFLTPPAQYSAPQAASPEASVQRPLQEDEPAPPTPPLAPLGGERGEEKGSQPPASATEQTDGHPEHSGHQPQQPAVPPVASPPAPQPPLTPPEGRQQRPGSDVVPPPPAKDSSFAPRSGTTEDSEGVRVSYQPAAGPAPDLPQIPEGSAEPVVRNVGAQAGDNDRAGGPLAGQAPRGQDPGVAGQDQAQQPPRTPQDPFSMGEDGLTDIERALGGL